MKKTWIEPRIEVQKFVPNEYVAACQRWGISCNTAEADKVEEKWMLPSGQSNAVAGQTHGTCGSEINQWLIDDNGDNIPDRLIETGTAGHGNLPCTLYTDATYTNKANFSDYNLSGYDGSKKIYLYWTSSVSDGRTWHHQGWLSSTKNGNHS